MKNIVLFGAGDTGSQVLRLIGSERVLCFADNNVKNIEYLGLPVVDFEKLKLMYMDNDDINIIVTSYDYYEVICTKLMQHNMSRFFVWMRSWGNNQNVLDKYYFNKLANDHCVDKYKSIALFANGHKIDYLLLLFDEINIKIDFFIDSESMNSFEDFCKIESYIDLLIIDVRRPECKIIDYVETNHKNYDVVNYFNYQKFLVNEKIASYRNSHMNQRCFVVGNGPSLRIKDLDMIHKHNEICFATNKIYHAFDETSWRPTYYMAQDGIMLKQHSEEIVKLETKQKFIADRCPPLWESLKFCKNVLKFHIKHEMFLPNMPEFSDDFSAYAAEGTSVTYSVLQLAAYMGFSEIYLIGVDNDYSGDFYKGENHFTKCYVASNDKFEDFHPDMINLAYQKAELVSRMKGFRIYNATRGGKLENFERIDFDTLFI